MVKVCERGRGTRGAVYYYVIDGRLLRHISRYSWRKVEDKLGRVFWDVQEEKVGNKPIIYFGFSNSGYCYVAEYNLRDFIGSEFEGSPRFENCKWGGSIHEHIHRLLGYEFEVSDERLKSLINDFKKNFVGMVNDVKKYAEKLGFQLFFAGHAVRLEEAFSNEPLTALYTCLSIPEDASRLRSLSNVCKHIHQLWVLKLVGEGLGAYALWRYWWSDKTYWRIEQGKPAPTCIFESPVGPFTAWFEFQVHEMAHLFGMFTGRREHVRPDIVIVRGAHEVTSNVKTIDLIIECKHGEFEDWSEEVTNQIPSYLKVFRPRLLILTSLKPIPVWARSYLEKIGIKVVDGLSPENLKKIDEFKKLIEEFKETF